MGNAEAGEEVEEVGPACTGSWVRCFFPAMVVEENECPKVDDGSGCQYVGVLIVPRLRTDI